MKWRHSAKPGFMEIRGRIKSRSHRLSPGDPYPSAGAGCGLPAVGRACRELTVTLVGTARLRVCLVSPLPPSFLPAPSLCSALPAQSCSRIKSGPSRHQGGARKHGKSSAVSVPVQRQPGILQPGLQPGWYPAPRAHHPSGSVAQQSRPAPCQRGLHLAYPSQGSETSCSCSSAWMGPSLEQRREPGE